MALRTYVMEIFAVAYSLMNEIKQISFVTNTNLSFSLLPFLPHVYISFEKLQSELFSLLFIIYEVNI